MQLLFTTLFSSLILWNAGLNLNVLASDFMTDPDESWFPTKNLSPRSQSPLRGEILKFHKQVTKLKNDLKTPLEPDKKQALLSNRATEATTLLEIASEYKNGGFIGGHIPQDTLKALAEIEQIYNDWETLPSNKQLPDYQVDSVNFRSLPGIGGVLKET